MARVDEAVQAAVERRARGGQVDRRRDRDRALQGCLVAAFSQPLEQRVSAERDADCGLRRELAQDPVDLLGVPGVIGARLAVGFTRAAAEVRNGDAPAALRGVGGDAARIVAVRAAFEPVEQREALRRRRIAGEVDVDEVAVGRVPALARQPYPRRRRERRADRLQVAEKRDQ
jgi:hypothetical protein